jgi:hypothetical protein
MSKFNRALKQIIGEELTDDKIKSVLGPEGYEGYKQHAKGPQPFEGGPGSGIEILNGELNLDVNGKRVTVVFQDSGEHDILDAEGNVLDSDSEGFQDIQQYVDSVFTQ